MKTLVTGGTGFLGTALCSRLEADGHDLVRVNSKSCDLREPRNLSRFEPGAYDRIYHLAAWTQAGDFCLYHPGEQWIINQQINTNVLSWWQAEQAQAKLICIGTSCAYDPALEMVEENYLAGTPIESLFTYAMTKRMLFVGLRALQQQFGLEYLYVVPSTLYGPGYHTDGRQMHFIFDLIRKIIRGKLYGEPVVLWGDGYQRRELIFVDDFVDAMLALDGSGRSNEIVNIGAGEEFSIRHFAELICGVVGFDADMIQYDTSRYVGARSKRLATEKLKVLAPGFAPRPLEVGLAKTIEWFWQEQESLLAERTPG